MRSLIKPRVSESFTTKRVSRGREDQVAVGWGYKRVSFEDLPVHAACCAFPRDRDRKMAIPSNGFMNNRRTRLPEYAVASSSFIWKHVIRVYTTRILPHKSNTKCRDRSCSRQGSLLRRTTVSFHSPSTFKMQTIALEVADKG